MKNKLIILAFVVIVVAVTSSYFILHVSNKSKITRSNLVVTKSDTKLKSTTTQAKVSNSVFSTKTNSTIGQYFATSSSQALYTYRDDSRGVSNCTGSCLANWPPYQDTGSVSNLPANVGTIKRSDNGEIQFTYKGLPLYTFSGDASGQVTGNNISNFEVAKP